jgi:adenylate cyclase
VDAQHRKEIPVTTAHITAQNQRQLQLLLDLDAARDALHDNDDPLSMFQAIAVLLREQFHADACALLLLDELGRDVEAVVTYGLSEPAAIKLCWQATRLSEPAGIPDTDWAHTLGLRVILNQSVLGSIFLARQTQPFDADEIALLKIAESQIDSAVIQARRMWKLAQRNRELEAIYQIDRLRDSHMSESDMINGFSSLLVEYFHADLCMVMLSHIDTGELIVRGIIDRQHIPVSVLDTIRDLSRNISLPQVITTPEGMDRMVLLAAPLIVAGVRLGAVVVGAKRTFTTADQRLIMAMTSQIDSAIVFSRTVQQLSQRNRELETIYKIDHIRDDEMDFERMLERVLFEICKAVGSEMGYLMLYNAEQESALELKATTIDGLITSPVYYEVIERISRQALEAARPVSVNRPDGPVRSIIAVPLILNERIIGVFGTANSHNPRGFNAEDERILTAITSQVDTAVFEQLERRRLRKVLGRSVDPKVLDLLLKRTSDNILAGERVHLTALFADLRGSTEWAEQTEPEQLVSALSIYLEHMTDTAFKFGGTLDKFVGDEVIVLFGVPMAVENHAYKTVITAMEMQAVHGRIQRELAEKGVRLPSMGIGIGSGEAIAGEIGPPNRTDYTALGRPMNMASRLCSVAPGGEIYISQETYDLLGNQVEVEIVEPTALKGLGSVPIYRLIHVRGL